MVSCQQYSNDRTALNQSVRRNFAAMKTSSLTLSAHAWGSHYQKNADARTLANKGKDLLDKNY